MRPNRQDLVPRTWWVFWGLSWVASISSQYDSCTGNYMPRGRCGVRVTMSSGALSASPAPSATAVALKQPSLPSSGLPQQCLTPDLTDKCAAMAPRQLSLLINGQPDHSTPCLASSLSSSVGPAQPFPDCFPPAVGGSLTLDTCDKCKGVFKTQSEEAEEDALV